MFECGNTLSRWAGRSHTHSLGCCSEAVMLLLPPPRRAARCGAVRYRLGAPCGRRRFRRIHPAQPWPGPAAGAAGPAGPTGPAAGAGRGLGLGVSDRAGRPCPDRGLVWTGSCPPLPAAGAGRPFRNYRTRRPAVGRSRNSCHQSASPGNIAIAGAAEQSRAEQGGAASVIGVAAKRDLVSLPPACPTPPRAEFRRG